MLTLPSPFCSHKMVLRPRLEQRYLNRVCCRLIASAIASLVIFAGCARTSTVADTQSRKPGLVLATGERPANPPNFVFRPPGLKSRAEKSKGPWALEEELARAMKALAAQKPKAYFIAYEVHHRVSHDISGRNGALVFSGGHESRTLDVDVRVGDYVFDSGHPMAMRGFDFSRFQASQVALPLEDDLDAVKVVAWRETNARYRSAAERFVELESRRKVDVALDDSSDDFSREKPLVSLEPLYTLTVDRENWEKRVRELSARFAKAPHILDSNVSLRLGIDTRWVFTSEGTRVQSSIPMAQITMFATAKTQDGLDLRRNETIHGRSVEGLPTQQVMEAVADKLVTDLKSLLLADPAEPYTGPAILGGRAAAVFFHEIFGHRAEGHRMKNDTDGQTFAKKVGEQVLPSFLSVFDDPTIARVESTDLNGHYLFDDEGIPAQRASLVENGILKGFLLNRTPTRGFLQSNGHGRRQAGLRIVSRQGNLVVQPSVAMSLETIQEKLRAEVRRRGLPYGLRFTEIEGGFTNTARGSGQVFKVLPVMVYKVFPDGRPDQLIRGADLVGTPLTAFSKILAASDDYSVFNGFCGAESGLVPVSGVSPSILIGDLEVERKFKGHEKPPVLPAPTVVPSKEVVQ